MIFECFSSFGVHYESMSLSTFQERIQKAAEAIKQRDSKPKVSIKPPDPPDFKARLRDLPSIVQRNIDN